MTAETASRPVLVDSSGWLEYLTEDTKAAAVEPYFTGNRYLLVPTIVLYEVRKKLLQGYGKLEADRFASIALRELVVPLDDSIALSAAEASLEHRLAMADAIVYATARECGAELVTSDPHFRGVPGATVL